MIIHDITLLPSGELHSRRELDSESIDPTAVTVCQKWLAGGGGVCPSPWLSHISLQLSSTGFGVITATLYSGEQPLTTNVLITKSADHDAERQAIAAVQQMIRRVLQRVPGAEPGYDLAGVRDRPLLASLILTPHVDLPLAADAVSCIAVAYFASTDL